MDHVPETKKSELEKLDEALQEETLEWNKLGMHGNMTTHTPESLWIIKLQLQALMNFVLKSGLATEEDINFEFKTLMLNDMRNMKEQAVRQTRAALVPKGKIDIPNIQLLGPDGKPVKF